MPTNINIWTSNWQSTGQTVQVDQCSLTVHIMWTDDEGIERDKEEEVLFPNCLAGEFTLPEQKRIAQHLMVLAIRKRFGIETEVP